MWVYHKSVHPRNINFLYTRNEKNKKLFGTFEKSFYLCTVRTKVLTIRAESREGARLHRHYSIYKKSHYKVTLFFRFITWYNDVQMFGRNDYLLNFF